MAIKVRVKEVRFFVRQVPMRMPFRFGVATLTSSAALHALMEVELEDGRRAVGAAGDMLAPKWFDKDPAKDYADNMRDLVAGAQAAAGAYMEAGRRADSVFALWSQGCEANRQWGEASHLNHLVAANGAALMERALIDGVGIAAGKSYFELLRENLLGIELGEVHPELGGMAPKEAIAAQPLSDLYVRHTVGLVDPVWTEDIERPLDDGLPQSLEEYVERQGLSYFKIKVGGDVGEDLQRLRAIAALLDRMEGTYCVTLDGNEQYAEMGGLLELLRRMEEYEDMDRFFSSMLYIEQPLDRRIALEEGLAHQVRAISARWPMLIDESDEDVDTFKRAVELGYRGVSSKACKGFVKALCNQALCRKLGGQYFVSGEDLTTIPVVPLHQDLAHLAALGIEHAERNGHHYVRGLDHLSPGELEGCGREHGKLYRREGESLFLDIRNGRIDLSSLQRPGLGVGVPVDTESMVPLEEWSPQSLSE